MKMAFCGSEIGPNLAIKKKNSPYQRPVNGQNAYSSKREKSMHIYFSLISACRQNAVVKATLIQCQSVLLFELQTLLSLLTLLLCRPAAVGSSSVVLILKGYTAYHYPDMRSNGAFLLSATVVRIGSKSCPF